MANALYDNGREGFLEGAIDWDTDTIKVTMVSTKYTFSASHEFLTSITSTQRVATSTALGTKTVTSGVAGAANITISSVTGVVVESLVLFKDTGSSGTSRLIAYIDTATGLPLTPNGANVTISWSTGANKIFKL